MKVWRVNLENRKEIVWYFKVLRTDDGIIVEIFRNYEYYDWILARDFIETLVKLKAGYHEVYESYIFFSRDAEGNFYIENEKVGKIDDVLNAVLSEIFEEMKKEFGIIMEFLKIRTTEEIIDEIFTAFCEKEVEID